MERLPAQNVKRPTCIDCRLSTKLFKQWESARNDLHQFSRRHRQGLKELCDSYTAVDLVRAYAPSANSVHAGDTSEAMGVVQASHCWQLANAGTVKRRAWGKLCDICCHNSEAYI